MSMDCKGCRRPGHSAKDCDYADKDPKMCNCQHRKTTRVKHAGEMYTAPEGVTGIVTRV